MQIVKYPVKVINLLVANMKNNKQKKTESTPSALLDSRQMNLNLLTLSFPREIEEEFLDNYVESSLPLVRSILPISIIFFGVFGILDAILLPEIKKTLWTIRYGFICPYLFLLFIVSLTSFFKKIMQPALASAMVWCGLCIIAMITIAPPPVNYSYYAGLILILMYGYTFIRARFIWATLSGWTIVGSYQMAAMLLSNTPFPILANNNFFFVSANIIGMFACYSMEYYARRDFFLARLLEDEKEKVNDINLKLEQRVQERTAQLKAANEDLLCEIEERKQTENKLLQSQKMQAIGTLAGGIAHDFNNILTAIIGYSELGLFKKKMDDKKTRMSFEQIHQAGERARDLVKQILTFSRQEEEKHSEINLSLIIKETLKLMRATVPSNIKIKSSIKTKTDRVFANPTQLHQVLMNLCTNAAHAMKGHTGELTVTLEDTCINKTEQNPSVNLPDGPYLNLKVTDTGTGIDPAVMERIFDPFFTTKEPGEGTGMGLSVVHGIVESHGGIITVDAELGRGSTFHILLPRLDNNKKALPERESEIPTGKECILFVDDEQALVDVGQEMLEEFGYNVVTKTSALDAFKTFCAHPKDFDLVITDKSMPNMTGFDLAEELLRVRPNLPIILCSGYNDKDDREKALSIGFKETINKPLVMRKMAESVRNALDLKNQQT